MQYNKLIDRATREREHFMGGERIYEDRCTGQSTGTALMLIGAAMIKPGTKVSIIEYTEDTIVRRRLLASRINELITKLELKFLQINLTDLTLVYNVYTTNPWEIK